jgi:hypothetical protein
MDRQRVTMNSIPTQPGYAFPTQFLKIIEVSGVVLSVCQRFKMRALSTSPLTSRSNHTSVVQCRPLHALVRTHSFAITVVYTGITALEGLSASVMHY